jgi:protocatechuate 3,4-dioxygenase beta subunit
MHPALRHRPFHPRRRLVVRAVGLALALPALFVHRPAAAAALPPTPAQAEGPFYPRTLPADRDADLTRIAGRSDGARGTRLYLAGRVTDEAGRPLAGIAVELWQCDSFGRYHHAGDEGRPRDDNFQGFGISVTDDAGRYAFKTIRPVPYGGRPPHLHFRLVRNAVPLLTTQLYVEGEARATDAVIAAAPSGTLGRLSIRLAAAPGREPDGPPQGRTPEREARSHPSEPGALAAQYDFVVRMPAG